MRNILSAILLFSLFWMTHIAYGAQTNQISQFGITWTFDTNYEYGQFANGDYWVVENSSGSGVTIININPLSVDNGGTILHGSMINPETGNVSTSGNGKHVWQGFDSRLYNYNADYNVARPNGSNLGQSNPLNIPAGSSLISAISNPATPNWASKVMALDTVAVLTVLDSAPSPGSFRPAYSGTDKRIKHNVADLDFTKLGSVRLVGSGINSLAAYERMVERPWLDFGHDTNGSYMHPAKNMQPDGAWLAAEVGQIALILNSSDYTNAEKLKLMIRFVQVGIDNYGVHAGTNVTSSTWNANGQIGSGRKFPILFAGAVLDNAFAASEMGNIGNLSVDAVGFNGPGYVSFAEDEQTFYVTAHPNSETDEQKRAIWSAGTDQDYDIFVPNPDSDIKYRPHPDGSSYYGHANPGKGNEYPEYMAGKYIPGTEFLAGAGHEGMPEWGLIHTFRRVYDGLSWSAPYRETNASRWGGFVLAAHIMGLKDKWNHNALFDYMDRYMTIQNDAQNPSWVGDMWRTYRNLNVSVATAPMPPSLTIE